jgi:ribonucleotide reductase alpha subunit
MARHESEMHRQKRLLQEENERLKDALRKIATGQYTRADEMLTSEQPRMIWELVAQAALNPDTGRWTREAAREFAKRIGTGKP